jgi:hypothetical protein
MKLRLSDFRNMGFVSFSCPDCTIIAKGRGIDDHPLSDFIRVA